MTFAEKALFAHYNSERTVLAVALGNLPIETHFTSEVSSCRASPPFLSRRLFQPDGPLVFLCTSACGPFGQ
jgi:hypothetical protein